MNFGQAVRTAGLLGALASCAAGLWALSEGGLADPPRSLDLLNIKVQWFAQGEEELPAWINAHFQVGPLGGITGTVTETDLDSDGTDEDGDPNGFETSVFNTEDGSLRGLSLGRGACAFTTVFLDPASGRVSYVLRRDGTAPDAWILSAACRNSQGLSFGHNRFPLTGDEKKPGAFEIYTAPDEADGPLPSL